MRKLLLLTVLATALGCAGDVEEPAANSQDETAAPAPQRRDFERSITRDFDDLHARLVATQVEPQPLRNVLLGDDEVASMKRRRFLAHLYEERDFEPVFIRDMQLDDRGRALIAALREVGAHALVPGDYLVRELEEALVAQEQLAPVFASLPAFGASREERQAIATFLEQVDEDAQDPALEALELALASDDPALAAFRRAHETRIALERAARGNAALLDALVSDAVLAYAFDQRHFNTTGVDLSEAERHQLIADRSRETFVALAAAPDVAAVMAIYEALPPQFPQYAGLVRERARYAAIVEAGGWENVTQRRLSRGSSGDSVLALSRRLAAEGFYTGEPTSHFDSSMEEAVRHYQETHQLDITGEPDVNFWSSLNVSAQQRLAQIELTLQRWRENRIGDDNYYVHINIPDFHTEVWRDGVREMRFRIVVGNTEQVCDPRTGRSTYVNATPIQSANMTYVVLNPTWNVPSRIVQEELLPAQMRDPTYFERNGFERYTTAGGVEIVRQLSGPQNPLGKVKFMFPNPHNTYLHDTSRPQYLDRTLRAFSHGCMRVQRPLDFLEYLLEQDGQWDDRQVQRIFDSGVETTIVLREPVPVHSEYYVVRIDDEGRANFLADIYRYDRERMDPSSVASGNCRPPAPRQRLVLGEDNQVLIQGADGERYTQSQWEHVQSGGTLERRADGSFADPPAPAPAAPAPSADPGDITAGDFGP